MPKPENYPWYELVGANDELDQGDILFGCPVAQVAASAPLPLQDANLPKDTFIIDGLILTQTCDIAQGKAPTILLCRHEPASVIAKDKQREIIKGRQPRYVMLERSLYDERPMEHRLVDLSAVYQLPIEFVRAVAASQTPRLRLLPPYREHISQAFARFFMRIGFPQDIRLD